MGKKIYCTPAILLLQGGGGPGIVDTSNEPNFPRNDDDEAKGADYEPGLEEEGSLWE